MKNKTTAALAFYISMTCLYIIVNLVIATKSTNIFIPIFSVLVMSLLNEASAFALALAHLLGLFFFFIRSLVSLQLKVSSDVLDVHYPVAEVDYADCFSISSCSLGCQFSCGISTGWNHWFKQSLATHVRAWSVSIASISTLTAFPH